MTIQLVEEVVPGTELVEEVFLIQLSVVEGSEYLALQAAAAATAAAAQVAQTKQEINDITPAITQEGQAQVQAVQDAGTAALESINISKTQALETIDPKVAQVTQDAKQVADDKAIVTQKTQDASAFADKAENYRNDIPILLENFFDPAIIALNSRIVADGATVDRKLYIIQLELGELVNEI